MSSRVWIFAAFGCYLLAMMGIGVFYYKRTKNSEDYFLGGRSLNGWVAALSAQASDTSGWLLIGAARGNLRIWHRADMDRCGASHRHDPQLDSGRLPSAAVYDSGGKFPDAAGVF